MNFFAPLFVVASFFSILTANAQEVSEEAVQIMKGAYYNAFDFLPPSRNCMPADIKGLWIEYGTYGAHDVGAEEGRHHLNFGGYNQFSEAYSSAAVPLQSADVPVGKGKVLKQYIVSVRGLLYFYEKEKLRSTHLCFIATEGSASVSPGDMLLMDRVEEGKPKVLAIYSPEGAQKETRGKKGKKHVR